VPKYVWHALVGVAILAGAFALLRSPLGRLVLAGMLGAFVGSFAAAYGQLRSSDRRY